MSDLYTATHLPQGAPTSPALSNLTTFQMDRRLKGLANYYDANYTRYADDLTFSGPKRLLHRSGKFLTTVESIVDEEGFRLNQRKTRIQTQAGRQLVNGLVVNQKLNAPRQEYDSLRATLFNCVRFGAESQNRERHPAFRLHLSGRINWIALTNPARGEKLYRLFDQIEWEVTNDR
ncbi:MAG: reverse transcriptase family protein [Pseudomonadota bacterium]